MANTTQHHANHDRTGKRKAKQAGAPRIQLSSGEYIDLPDAASDQVGPLLAAFMALEDTCRGDGQNIAPPSAPKLVIDPATQNLFDLLARTQNR